MSLAPVHSSCCIPKFQTQIMISLNYSGVGTVQKVGVGGGGGAEINYS